MIAALYTDFPIKYFKHKDVYLVKINITYNFYVCTYTYVYDKLLHLLWHQLYANNIEHSYSDPTFRHIGVDSYVYFSKFHLKSMHLVCMHFLILSDNFRTLGVVLWNLEAFNAEFLMAWYMWLESFGMPGLCCPPEHFNIYSLTILQAWFHSNAALAGWAWFIVTECKFNYWIFNNK